MQFDRFACGRVARDISTPTVAADRDKNLPTLVSELWAMVVTYLKQETLLPIRALGRFVAFGLAGSLVLSVGLVLLSLALLRALQTETTTFSDDWSWAPYAITLVVSALAAILSVRAITAKKRQAARKGTVA